MGKYIFGLRKARKYIYYGRYKSSSQKNVMIYRARLDGSQQTKLFIVKGRGDYAQSVLNGVNNGKIEVLTSIDGKFVVYVYDIKTKKLKKRS